jgi:hypothetical protein
LPSLDRHLSIFADGLIASRRYTAWCNRHAQDRVLREVVKRAIVACAAVARSGSQLHLLGEIALAGRKPLSIP